MDYLPNLKEEFENGLDQAIDAAHAMKARLDNIVSDLGPLAIGDIGNLYEQADGARRPVSRILIDLMIIRDRLLKGRLDGLDAFDLAEIERLAAAQEDEETRGDRAYHEAKDEGRVK